MRARRVWAGVVAAGVVAGLGIAGAAPASAAPSAGCALLNGDTGSGPAQVVWETEQFAAGERLTVTWSALSDPDARVELYVPGDVLVDVIVGAGSVTYLFASDLVAGGNSVAGAFGTTGTWSITCGAPGLTSELTSDRTSEQVSPIPAWIQAYGRAADAGCADGWDASWQEWAAPVTGGWVCTRSIPSIG